MIRLIGIDIDGTLIGSSGAVDPLVWEAAQRAEAAGIHLALCTGRPAFGVALEYAKRLDCDGWHVFQNGASVVNLATQEFTSAPIPGDAVAVLIAQARATGRILELYGDSIHVAESNATWLHEHAQLLGVPFAPQPFESLTQPVVRAQWLLSAEAAALLDTSRYPGFEVALSSAPQMPDVRFVGLTRTGVSKGAAISAVATAYGVDLRDVMYVGDASNDLPALEIVGCPVAMGNAEAAVMAAAAHTVSHVDAGGLAQALEMALVRNRT